ncbi:MAG TPA: NAD(P)/FAD-dependent oxidoreductase [Gemmatimonadaceae bacterium]|nr:NAD(P)/FAD-dependent oxidoreductase [Gemmatimonadaceae bacterium]
MDERFPVVVVGAGPAGLATSRELTVRGVKHVVLERGDGVAHSWANSYDSLTLHTGKHMSALPGLRIPREAPLFVPRDEFVRYLGEYARHFDLPVRTQWDVRSIDRITSGEDRWRVRASTPTGDATIECRDVIIATGIMANPRVPSIAGADAFQRAGGQLIHSVVYRRPSELIGNRILVIGVGNSGGEIASELARAGVKDGNGTHVTIAVRSGANVVPREIFGLPIQYLAFYIRKLPRAAREAVVRLVGKIVENRRGPPVLPRPAHGPLDAIPLIGFNLVDAIRDGLVEVRGGVERLTARGAVFADGKSPAEEPFDVVILATGFAPALALLGRLIRVDAKGFALRHDRVTSADHDGLYFVGHNYDATGGLYNIARDAPLVAQKVESRA